MWGYLSKLLIFLHVQGGMSNVWLERNPRYLPFPRGVGNKLQVITGFGIPVPDIKHDVTYGLIIKTNYELPTNSSMFTQPDLAFEDSKDGTKINRLTWYKLLQIALDRLNFRGESCLLLTICQATFTVFEQQGLLGEIIKVLFLPSTTSGEADYLPNDYFKAEKLGQDAEDEEECRKAYPSCDKSIIDMLTTIEDNTLIKMILDNM